MNPQTTRRPLRGALAIYGARSARRDMQRTAVIGRQLDQIAPSVATVRTVPVMTDGLGGSGRRYTAWVALDNALGQPVTADRTAHRAVRQLLLSAFPGADWSRPQTYDVTTGQLAILQPLTAPAGLGIDTAEAAR
ncbi:hypothetical protein [Streptomyces sp. NPDC057729]|uniref:hypothetical protein n=1 Tax=Streptomyces sp. NPDC057729 TaxID=3346230 RepID=UPI0036C0B2F2